MGWFPPASNGWWVIDNLTWVWDSLVQEPSTPGNELSAWYISLTEWDCSGATWYCNSSKYLISHFSSIMLAQWKTSHTHTVNVCRHINMSMSICLGASAGCSQLTSPTTLQRQQCLLCYCCDARILQYHFLSPLNYRYELYAFMLVSKEA